MEITNNELMLIQHQVVIFTQREF